MAVQNIRQKLESIDYSVKNLSTYLVFVPGLSLLIQKVQTAKTLPLPAVTSFNFDPLQQEKSTRFAAICKWSLRGSMTQAIVCMVAFSVFQMPIFGLLALVAGYEMIDTIRLAIQNTVTKYELNENGSLKGMTLSTPLSVF